MAIVYIARNCVNDKAYVGFTTRTLDKRIRAHMDSVKAGSKFLFHNAIRKHGIDSFNWEVLEEGPKGHMLKMEQALIKRFASKAPNGYNLTAGGEGSLGHKVSDKGSQKISETITKTNFASWSNSEYRKKMSAMSRAKWQDPEYKAQQFESRKQRWKDPEQRALMSAKMKESWAKRRRAA